MTAAERYVTSLRNGIDVLQALSTAPRGLTLAEIAASTGTTRATARRLALTFQELGYVRADGTTFRARPRVMTLGDRYLEAQGLTAIAHPHLEELAATVRDTCSLTILDGPQIVYVDRVRGPRMMTANIAVGTRLPADRLSSGRAILSTYSAEELAEWLAEAEEHATGQERRIREDIVAVVAKAAETGYALTDRELDPALRSIAAPVLGPSGRAIGAVNVSTAVSRTSNRELEHDVLPELLAAAARIGSASAEAGANGI